MSTVDHSLVKYSTPILVGSAKNRASSGKAPPLPPVETAKSQTEDILNSLLPPREWTENGQLWAQYVSSTPATRLDVTNLQEKLDAELRRRKARETGICPVREDLYAQCFDELIRQITINCSERGLLLLRIRDEIRMTVSSYQTLYESSIAYGIRKSLLTEFKRAELQQNVKTLKIERDVLEEEVKELEERCQSIHQRAQERHETEEKEHQVEVERIQQTNHSLKQQLEQLLAGPKK